MAWVWRRPSKGGTQYLAGYTDPTGAQRAAGTLRSRSEAERAAHAAWREVAEGPGWTAAPEGHVPRLRKAVLVAEPAPP
jgi:hypothetical protein